MWVCGFLLPFASAIVPDFGPDFVPSDADNMNGEYVFSSTPGGTPGLFPKRFADYPGGAEYFEVYSPPMTTHYSQVWWSPLAPSPFPVDIVAKYAGKSMVIIGWEIDQVQKKGSGQTTKIFPYRSAPAIIITTILRLLE